MPKLKRSPEGMESRSKRQEALAASVRECAEAAVRALHAASKDRQAIHAIEWKQTERDTLADIDEIADALQGFAAWVTSGAGYPNPARALDRLGTIRKQERTLRGMLFEHSKRWRRLWEYLGRQETLHDALEAYFEEELRGVSLARVRNGRQPVRKSA